MTDKPLDLTKPCYLRETKKPVRILCTDASTNYPVIGITADGDVYKWTMGGRYSFEDVLIGMGMALTQLVFGMNGNAPTEQNRQGLHELIDICWMMTASHPASLDSVTKQ